MTIEKEIASQDRRPLPAFPSSTVSIPSPLQHSIEKPPRPSEEDILARLQRIRNGLKASSLVPEAEKDGGASVDPMTHSISFEPLLEDSLGANNSFQTVDELALSNLDFPSQAPLLSPGSYFASKSKAMGEIQGNRLLPQDRPYFDTPNPYNQLLSTPMPIVSATASPVPAGQVGPKKPQFPFHSSVNVTDDDPWSHFPSGRFSSGLSSTVLSDSLPDPAPRVALSSTHLTLVQVPDFTASLMLTNLDSTTPLTYELIWAPQRFRVVPSHGTLPPAHVQELLLTYISPESGVPLTFPTELGVLVQGRLVRRVRIEFVPLVAASETRRREPSEGSVDPNGVEK